MTDEQPSSLSALDCPERQVGAPAFGDLRNGDQVNHAALEAVAAHIGTDKNGEHGEAAELARLRAENAELKASLERKQIAIQGAEMGVWEFSPQVCSSFYASPNAIALLGCVTPPDEKAYDLITRSIYPGDLKNLNAALRRFIVRPSGKFVAEVRVRCGNGEMKWWLIRAVATKQVGGEGRRSRRAMRVVGSVVDITRRRTAENALHQSAEWHTAVFDSLPLPMYVHDRDTLEFLAVNNAAVKQYGYSREEFLSLRVTDIRPQDDVQKLLSAMIDIEEKQAVNFGIWRHQRKDGTTLLADITCSELLNKTMNRRERLIMAHDVTAQVQAQQAVAESENRYRSLFMNAIEGIYQTTPGGKYLRLNPALARMYGYDDPEQVKTELQDIAGSLYVSPTRRAEFVALALGDQPVENFVSEIRQKNGATIWISENARCVRDSDGEVLYFEGTVENVTARVLLEQERESMLLDALDRADRDPLTGLLNHRAFHKRLTEEADRAQRTGTKLAVAVLDLDNFKFFNDAYGHVAGDAVLRTVTSTLRTCCRSYDILSRFGGDEFAILVPDATLEHAHQFAQRIKSAMAETGFAPAGYDTRIPLGVTVGVALFPDEAVSRTDVIELADRRLRRAKTGGDQDGVCEQLRSIYSRSHSGFSILDALVTAVDNKDRYTRRHSEDVTIHCLSIGHELGLAEQELERLQLSALLHDVGKIGVPDAILRKPGQLTESEMAAVQQHAQMGAMIVSAVPGFNDVLDGIRHHHERWDGRGYPEALSREEIPQIARIMAVADAFSAMTTSRPYRTGMPVEQAMSILDAGSGVQWDPECVAAFRRARANPSGLSGHLP